jgi:hypothetical protein
MKLNIIHPLFHGLFHSGFCALGRRFGRGRRLGFVPASLGGHYLLCDFDTRLIIWMNSRVSLEVAECGFRGAISDNSVIGGTSDRKFDALGTILWNENSFCVLYELGTASLPETSTLPSVPEPRTRRATTTYLILSAFDPYGQQITVLHLCIRPTGF